MKGKQKKRVQRMQERLYDELFRQDPEAANMVLLVLELEQLHEKEGVKPCFSTFEATGDQLGEFMVRNQGALTRLFNERFADPGAYCFDGTFKGLEFRTRGDFQ